MVMVFGKPGPNMSNDTFAQSEPFISQAACVFIANEESAAAFNCSKTSFSVVSATVELLAA